MEETQAKMDSTEQVVPKKVEDERHSTSGRESKAKKKIVKK